MQVCHSGRFTDKSTWPEVLNTYNDLDDYRTKIVDYLFAAIATSWEPGWVEHQ